MYFVDDRNVSVIVCVCVMWFGGNFNVNEGYFIWKDEFVKIGLLV